MEKQNRQLDAQELLKQILQNRKEMKNLKTGSKKHRALNIQVQILKGKLRKLGFPVPRKTDDLIKQNFPNLHKTVSTPDFKAALLDSLIAKAMAQIDVEEVKQVVIEEVFKKMNMAK